VKADLTRDTYEPRNRYSQVLMQQGRVQLDADWNEQGSILLGYMRRLTADLFGPHGAMGPTAGFALSVLPSEILRSGTVDFAIGHGRYYVDGEPCELGSTPAAVTIVEADMVRVSDLAPDGQAFQADQYVELFDANDPGHNAVPARIVTVDGSGRALKLALPAGINLKDAASKEGVQPRLRRLASFLSQPDITPAPKLPDGRYQIYLDVWSRVVTAAEDPAIREVALNGPDTAARIQTVWQVKALGLDAIRTGDGTACLLPGAIADALRPGPPGLLRARVKPGGGSVDPCTIAPDSLYRGPENQLYRVEIHTGDSSGPNSPPATFKWSRENGSVVLPIVAPITGTATTSSVSVASLGRDERFGVSPGDWVEVTDNASPSDGAAGPLLQVQSLDRTRLIVALSGTVAAGKDPALHPILRRWDQRAGDTAEGGLGLAPDNAALIPNDESWLDLEDGIQIQFVRTDTSRFGRGDYWLIPARVSTGDVEWPVMKVAADEASVPLALPPRGIVHRYAPLGIVQVAAAKASSIQDCRNLYAMVRYQEASAVTGSDQIAGPKPAPTQPIPKPEKPSKPAPTDGKP
jgi:hypothetical protein